MKTHKIYSILRGITTFVFAGLLIQHFRIDNIWFWVFAGLFLIHGSFTYLSGWHEALSKAENVLTNAFASRKE